MQISLMGLMFLGGWGWIGWLVDRWIGRSKSWIERVVGTLVWMGVVVPGVVIRLHTDLGIRLSKQLVLWVLLALALGLMMVWKRQRNKVRFDGKHLLVLFVVGVIGYLMVGRELFRLETPLIGADSVAYIHGSALLERRQDLGFSFDRNLIHVNVGMLSWLSGMAAEDAFRVFSFYVYGLNALVVYLLVSELIDENWAGVGAVMALVNTAVLQMVPEFVPMLMASSLMVYMLWWLVRYKRGGVSMGWKEVMVWGGLWGSLFHIHGIVAFASLGVWGGVWSWHWLWWRKIIKQERGQTGIKLALVFLMVGLVARPMVGNGMGHLWRSIIEPLFDSVVESVQVRAGSTVSVIPTQVGGITADKWPTWKDFPVYRREWIERYSWWLGLAGLGMLDGFLRSGKRSFGWGMVGVVSGVYWLLTLQPYLGINWYAPRFVGISNGLVVFWAVCGLKVVWRLIGEKKWWLRIGLVAWMLAGSYANGAEYVRANYRPAISQDEYEFYKRMSVMVELEEGLVFSTSQNFRWQMGLAPSLNQREVVAEAICQKGESEHSFRERDWEMGESFSLAAEAKETERLLDPERFGVDALWLVLDKRNRCINFELFEGGRYELVLESNDLELVRVGRD